MALSDVGKVLHEFLGYFVSWAECVRNPIEACRTALSTGNPKARLHKGLTLWLAAFMVTIGCQLPIYKLFGMDAATTFYISYAAAVMLGIVLAGVSVHCALKLFRLESQLIDTVVIYMITVGCYAPVFAMFNAARTYLSLSSLRFAKASHLDLRATLQACWQAFGGSGQMNWIIDSMIVMDAMAHILVTVLLCITAKALSERYSADRYRTFVAVGFGFSVIFMVLVTPSIIVGYLISYAFVPQLPR
jgi:hypothetical protein